MGLIGIVKKNKKDLGILLVTRLRKFIENKLYINCASYSLSQLK